MMFFICTYNTALASQPIAIGVAFDCIWVHTKTKTMKPKYSIVVNSDRVHIVTENGSPVETRLFTQFENFDSDESENDARDRAIGYTVDRVITIFGQKRVSVQFK